MPATPSEPSAKHEGPLPELLLVLTFTTGVVDAVSYLGLGHVFVANMTGNVVFLGFAVSGSHDFSLHALAAALIGFLCGALAGGRLGLDAGAPQARLLALGLLLEVLLVGAALAFALGTPADQAVLRQTGLVALLALAMGTQNAVARRLAVPDLTTTVLTLTLTGLAADPGTTPEGRRRARRRLAATAAMLVGAGVGALLLLRFGMAAPLALALGLLVASGAAACRHAVTVAS